MTEKVSGHQPVLLAQAVAALAVKADGAYVDGTFGRGGHSAAIRAQLGELGCLVAIDRDLEAVAVGRQWAQQAPGAGRVIVEHAWFSQFGEVLDAHGLTQIDGLLLDLGVSSPQIDDPARGFSFREDGPLDMRMDTTRGESVRQWLARATVQEIKEALKTYGEERFALPIAEAIDARRKAVGPEAFQTTSELARLVAAVYVRRQKRPEVGKNPATRSFQALRIFINQELAELQAVLDRGVARLRPGGRLVVISFHSIEDRMVKQFIHRETGRDAPRDPIMGTPIYEHPPRLKSLARVLPNAVEIQSNPRSRSAVMRVAEKVVA